MKICPSCHVMVGGSFEHCPMCQNALQGEGEIDYFPAQKKLEKQSLLYKMQLFICAIIVVVSLVLDWMLDLYVTKHWSLMVLLWIVALQWIISHFIKKHTNIIGTIAYLAIWSAVLVLLTGKFFNIMSICLNFVLPGICMLTLVINFVFSMIDQSKNAMVYLLCNVLIGIVPNLVIPFKGNKPPILWIICLMISIITLIGLIIFKGKKVLTEIQKRLNF